MRLARGVSPHGPAIGTAVLRRPDASFYQPPSASAMVLALWRIIDT